MVHWLASDWEIWPSRSVIAEKYGVGVFAGKGGVKYKTREFVRLIGQVNRRDTEPGLDNIAGTVVACP
jgi:hypothetical protein